MSELTDFGYEQVTPETKTKKVSGVFSSVASNYDIMNDVMSFGIHRLWKKRMIQLCSFGPTSKIIDIASGSGDIALSLSNKMSEHNTLWLTDINHEMLSFGKKKMLNNAKVKNIHYAQGNAECLPFPDNYADLVTIAFGLRNVTDKQKALDEMHRILKPKGRAVILEFSKPQNDNFSKIYDFYSFSLIPLFGQIIAKDKDSYKYLVESIRKHPDQNKLKLMMQESGFLSCEYENLTNGIVAIHHGQKKESL